MMATVNTDNVCIVPTNFKESNLIGPRVTTCFVPPYKCLDGPTKRRVKLTSIIPSDTKKVVIDLPSVLPNINLAGLGADLFPRASAMNALATEGAKQRIVIIIN